MTDDDLAPGWDALEAAFQTLYPGQEPRHVGTVVKYAMGGSDPLDGLSVYDHGDHWHYLTFGFSDLYQNHSEDTEESGFGFEMTMRLLKPEGEETPPMWVWSMLQNLARYVFNSGNVFEPGHYINANGPIALNTDTLLTGVAFINDPELPEWLETPHGKLRFLQAVGLTAEETEACRAWDTSGVTSLITERYPLAVTDMERLSVLEDPEAARTVEEGIASQGSSTGMLMISHCVYDCDETQLKITLGANAVTDVQKLLSGNIPHGRTLTLVSDNPIVMFSPAEAPGWRLKASGTLVVDLDPISALVLADELRPEAGTYEVEGFPGFLVEVIPSQILDPEGNVVRTVG